MQFMAPGGIDWASEHHGLQTEVIYSAPITVQRWAAWAGRVVQLSANSRAAVSQTKQRNEKGREHISKLINVSQFCKFFSNIESQKDALNIGPCDPNMYTLACRLEYVWACTHRNTNILHTIQERFFHHIWPGGPSTSLKSNSFSNTGSFCGLEQGNYLPWVSQPLKNNNMWLWGKVMVKINDLANVCTELSKAHGAWIF